MMKITILASGSKGNSTYVEIGNHKILIDAGISLRQVKERMDAAHLEISSLDAIFVTHEHSDHTMGLSTLVKKFNCPVYLSQGTYRNLPRAISESLSKSVFRFIEFHKVIEIDGYSVLPFMTFHDALEPTGYRFTESGKSFVYMTDTGYFPESQFDLLRNADLYVIESNHEPDLLLDSDRPWVLKRRILDDKGHLSNEDSAFLTLNLIGERTKRIVLAHLSEECNTEEHAIQTYRRVFRKQGMIFEDYQIECAKQHVPFETIEIS